MQPPHAAETERKPVEMGEVTVSVPIDASKLNPDAGLVVLALKFAAPEGLSEIRKIVASAQEIQAASRGLKAEAQRFLKLNPDVKEFLAFFQERDLQRATDRFKNFTDSLEPLKEAGDAFNEWLQEFQELSG